MIKTESEYNAAVTRLRQDQEIIAEQVKAMRGLGLTEEQIDHASKPTLSFHEQLKEEVEVYEKMRRGVFEPISNLEHIGQLLIGLRICLNLSQNDLASKLGISQAAVSKDERNEYHGISVEKAQRIFVAMGVRITLTLDEPVLKAANG